MERGEIIRRLRELADRLDKLADSLDYDYVEDLLAEIEVEVERLESEEDPAD